MRDFSLGDRIKIVGENLKFEGVLVEHPPQFIENTPFVEGHRLEDYPDYVSIKLDNGEIYLINASSYIVEHAR